MRIIPPISAEKLSELVKEIYLLETISSGDKKLDKRINESMNNAYNSIKKIILASSKDELYEMYLAYLRIKDEDRKIQ